MPAPQLAFLAQGKLHLYGAGAEPRPMESVFGCSLRDRAAEIHNRHAWKTQGRGAQFMSGMLWPAAGHDPGEFRMAITGVCRGGKPGEILYALETDEVGGIFAVDSACVEKRIFHTSDFRVRYISVCEDGSQIAASIFHNDFTSNIALMDVDGGGFEEVTEGDSLDLAPSWVGGGGRSLVFQSAGIGRDGSGRISGLGPFHIHRIDLTSGSLEVVAEDKKHDFLGPRMAAGGTLYCIRRPYESGRARFHLFHALKDAVLFPFRFTYAVFQYLNFFTLRYTGRPLTNRQGAVQRQPDLKQQMMIWGNLVNADQAAREDQAGTGAPSLVPSSWQLVRQAPGGAPAVIAKNVLCFDLARDGGILYSNGSAVHRVTPGGRVEKILEARMIEQVAALD